MGLDHVFLIGVCKICTLKNKGTNLIVCVWCICMVCTCVLCVVYVCMCVCLLLVLGDSHVCMCTEKSS